DDFNTSGAVAVLFDLATKANRESCGKASGLMRSLGGLLGLLQKDPAVYLRSATRYQRQAVQTDEALDEAAIEALIQERTEAKTRRDFARAD
ncbi:DALR domain-containing protein, partial [Salmonella enterica subsp. enterica serovar 1,4,[5],12:i:-]